MTCCIANERGFKCLCRKKNPLYSKEAEDDGYGDYLHDLYRDRRDMKQLTKEK
jgi:hypothetical protein